MTPVQAVSKTKLPAAIVVLLVACLAGCGGGSKATSVAGETGSSATSSDGSETSGGDTASARGFIARADAICGETNAQLASTQTKASPQGVAARVVEHQAIERKANGRLAQLTPPAGIASTWRKLLGYRRSLANQLGLLAAAARRRAAASVKLLGASKKKLHGELRRVATNAGFTDCARVGSS
jgi:hypothetical protein